MTSHERLWSLRFTQPAMIASLISAGVILLVGIFSLIAFTPIKNLIPGYPNAHSRRLAAQNALRVDSLENKILQWELYTENMRRVVAGEDPIKMDSLVLGTRASREAAPEKYLALRDSILRADVQKEEQFFLASGTDAPRRMLPIEALSFYTPVKGVISRPFELSLHPWADITAPAGSVIMSVLDGSVIYTFWEDESGYTVVMQHQGDIVSIYKNNEKLLHKTGDRVKAGTPIAVLASSNSLTRGDHLHFELWCDGKAVDPALYIKF